MTHKEYCLPFGVSSKIAFIFQNILKRTTPGSRDEDTATKAFNELKKVVITDPNSQLHEQQYYRW